MSDKQTTGPVGADTASTSGPSVPHNLSPAQIASARATWIGAGLSQEQVRAELARHVGRRAPVVANGPAPAGPTIGGSPEQLAERVRLASVALTYALEYGASPDGIEVLTKSGAMDRAYTLATLANEGARLEGWLKGPKTGSVR
jgi:hypothetical protein